MPSVKSPTASSFSAQSKPSACCGNASDAGSERLLSGLACDEFRVEDGGDETVFGWDP